MTPPKDKGTGTSAEPPAILTAVSVVAPPKKGPPGIETLRKRPEFLKAASARRQGTGSFLLQARARNDDSAVVRIGFTASKKIGNAVARNRAKRRLRAVARDVLPGQARSGWDYVIVAKPVATIARSYAELCEDLVSALRSVHRDRP